MRYKMRIDPGTVEETPRQQTASRA